jgi:rare lipoprotein A
MIAASALIGSAHSGHAARASHKVSRTVQPPAGADKTDWVEETGTASYYSNAYHGRRSANGARFDQKLLTAAHAWLPFGTKVRVTIASTGQSVIVVVTDRIYSARRVVDLSMAAARELGMLRMGVARVSLTPA